MFVVFTSTVELRISAVYMGGVLLAEHDSMPPCMANRAAGNVTIGGTNRLEMKNLLPLQACSLTEPKQLTLILNKSHFAIIYVEITSKITNRDSGWHIDTHIHTWNKVTRKFVEQCQAAHSKPREKS